MRMMLKASIPVEGGNNAVKSGELPKVMQHLLETLKPEAAYFTTERGRRTALIFFDLKSPSDIPSIAEPLFQGTNADVQFTPVMNADDLRAGLQKALGGR